MHAAAAFPQLSSLWTLLGIMIAVTTFGLFLIGLQRAYRLLRGEVEVEATGTNGLAGMSAFKLLWRRGLFGGFFGGIIAAPIITTAYYFSAVGPSAHLPAFGQLLTETTIACVIIGVLLGLLALTAAEQFEARRTLWPQHRWIVNSFAGAVLGGIIAGVICGPWVTLYFGLKDRPFVVPYILLLGAIPGTAVMIFSILNYTLDRINLVALAKSGVASLLAVVVVGVVAGGLGLLFQGPIEQIAASVPYEWTAILLAGLPYGVAIGIALGAVFGLALAWTGAREQVLAK
jgi:hypothetical protein